MMWSRESNSAVGRATASVRPLFFFFQAEDGIRDYKVTGVQTCALPISHHRSPPSTDQLLLDRCAEGEQLAALLLALELELHPGGVLGDAHHPSLVEEPVRSEEHTSELQSPCNLVCRLLLEKKKKATRNV